MTNYVVLFAALHELSVVGIGQFTLAYTATILVVTTTRSLLLEPLTIRFTAADAEARRKASAKAAGASLAFGVFGAIIAISVAGLLADPARGIVGAAGLIWPALLLQDAWRFHFFASGRPWAAVLNDGACLLFTLIAVALVLRRPGENVELLLLAWGLGTSAGALIGMPQSLLLPDCLRARQWLSHHGGLGLRLAGERIIGAGVAQISLIIVGAVAGTHAMGQLGASRSLMAPATTLVSALILFAVPEASRILAHTPARLPGFIARFSGAIVAAIVVITSIALLIPQAVGEVFAGENWETAKTLLVPVALWTAASGSRQGPSAALRVFDRGSTILRLSLFGAPLVLASTAIGASVGGGAGAAWSFAAIYCIVSLVWWLVYLRIVRQSKGVVDDS